MAIPYFLFTLLGFVLGSTLFAYWIPKLLKNIDICTLPDLSLIHICAGKAIKEAAEHKGHSVTMIDMFLLSGKGTSHAVSGAYIDVYKRQAHTRIVVIGKCADINVF